MLIGSRRGGLRSVMGLLLTMGQTAGGHIAGATPHPSALSPARHAGSGPRPGPRLVGFPAPREQTSVQLRSWAGPEPGGEHNGGRMFYITHGDRLLHHARIPS